MNRPKDPLEQAVYVNQIAFAPLEKQIKAALGEQNYEQAITNSLNEISQVIQSLIHLREVLSNIAHSSADQVLVKTFNQEAPLLKIAQLTKRFQELLNLLRIILTDVQPINQLQTANPETTEILNQTILRVHRLISNFSQHKPVNQPKLPLASFDENSALRRYLQTFIDHPEQLISRGVNQKLTEIYNKLTELYGEITTATSLGIEVSMAIALDKTHNLKLRMEAFKDLVDLVAEGVLDESSTDIQENFEGILIDFKGTLATTFVETLYLHGQNIVFLLQQVNPATLRKLLKSLQIDEVNLADALVDNQQKRQKLSPVIQLISKILGPDHASEHQLIKERQNLTAKQQRIQGQIVDVATTIKTKSKIDDDQNL